MGFHHEIFGGKIQKEAIAHLKRENQFWAKEIWESLKTDLLREFCKPGLKLDFTAHGLMSSSLNFSSGHFCSFLNRE
jgi:hypothetical protein